MSVKDKIEKYISESEEDKKEIMIYIRSIILKNFPQITENWKWRVPNFEYKGLLSWHAAFKEFVSLNFYKGAAINDIYDRFDKTGIEEKNNRIIKIKKIDEVKEQEIIYYFEEAIRLNEKGIVLDSQRKEIPIPPELQTLLDLNDNAKTFYNSLSPSKQREYNEWIAKAKRADTKTKRVKLAIDKLNQAEGLNDKYQT